MLIGCSVAIGLRHGLGKDCIPLEDEAARGEAVMEVGELFQSFLDEFGSTECRTLIGCDLSQPEEQARYMKEKIYEDRCFRFFYFVMTPFFKSAAAGADAAAEE
jgi:hypothetical protein